MRAERLWYDGWHGPGIEERIVFSDKAINLDK
jgi:hypothetical protein